MKRTTKSQSIRAGFAALLAALALASTTASAQHVHAGAFSTAQDAQLYFADGAGFVNTSGFVKNLIYTNAGTWAGYYQGSFTFTAATTNTANSDYNANHAALGSFIELRFETVISGPAGGVFSFWESGALTPTASLGVGDTGSFQFDLSDVSLGAGNPGNDPYGHLHGRRYTATEMGEYLVGFRLYDTSTNGVGGGPIHTPGDLFVMKFAAVPEPATTAMLGIGAVGGLMLALRRRKR